MTAPDPRAERQRIGLSQAQLGARLRPSTDQTTISGYETGRRRIPPGYWQALERVRQEIEAGVSGT